MVENIFISQIFKLPLFPLSLFHTHTHTHTHTLSTAWRDAKTDGYVAGTAATSSVQRHRLKQLPLNSVLAYIIYQYKIIIDKKVLSLSIFSNVSVFHFPFEAVL